MYKQTNILNLWPYGSGILRHDVAKITANDCQKWLTVFCMHFLSLLSEFYVQPNLFRFITLTIPCSVVLWYNTDVSEDFAASIFRANGCRKVLRNVGILPHHCTMSQPRRLRHESLLLWKHQISHFCPRLKKLKLY